MKVLVFNAGSSSLKCGIFDMSREDARIFKAEFERFEGGTCLLHVRAGGEEGEESERQENIADIGEAIRYMPTLLEEYGYTDFDAVGHRVAHGGEKFTSAVQIDDEVFAHIEDCNPLAPLHNPVNLQAITLGRELWKDKPHIAIFDTAFHHTIPESAYSYAVPKAWRETGLRRYGFHGTSHKYVALRVAEALHQPVTELKIISCHLGNGASLCAINHGFSLDTSMGMTPLEGLVMGTRSGDVDPGIFAHLEREMGLSISEIENALYKESGLKALAGTKDLRDVEELAADGDKDAQLALHVYAYRARKYIGAYAAVMGGLDVLAFTGGIGENSASMRRRICDRLGFLGLYMDDIVNQSVKLRGKDAVQLQTPDSRIKVIVTKTNEQWMIAKETQQLLSAHKPAAEVKIPVAVSARHVHLSQAHVEALFGKGHQLKKLRDLSQPEGWAAEEVVEVVGVKGSLQHVRVLGPVRERTQIEVSRTDTFTLGLEAPVRPSGKLDDTPMVTLKGTVGEVRTDGLIIAARHIHMHPNDAEKMGVKDGDYVNVCVGDGERSIMFNNTLIRVKDSYVTEMHIDTDEANAAGINIKTEGELIMNEQKDKAALVSHQPLTLNHTQEIRKAA